MNKIIIRLYVPMIEQEFDLKIPKNKKIYNIISIIMRTVDEMCGGCYKPKDMPSLYDKVTAIPYEMTETPREAKIKNGAELVLI